MNNLKSIIIQIYAALWWAKLKFLFPGWLSINFTENQLEMILMID